MLPFVSILSVSARSAGNCSDPTQYKPSPITHKSNPCDDFCSNKCDFSPTPATELTLIRMTPRNTTGIANKDTGDDSGDLFFTLLSASKPSECDKPNPPPWAGCFLNGDNIFIRSKVAVDGKYGTYQECNPAKVALPSAQANSGSFVCCGTLVCSAPPSPFEPNNENSSKFCNCDRTNHTVGKILVTEQFSGSAGKFAPSYLSETAEKVGGHWFSTPAEGECKGSEEPGTGNSDCSWKIKETLSVINQTCVKGNVYGAVEKNCPAAFESCPNPYNRTEDCYTSVFFASISGNKTFNCPEMTRDDLLKPWLASFNGGCPPVTLD